MVLLSENKIEWIRTRIREHGISDSDLSESLVDHLCCLAESQIKNEDEFYSFIEGKINTMHPNGLKALQIEKESIVINLKNIVMKKTTTYLILISLLFLTFGTLFKIFHQPGAAACLILGAGLGSIAMVIAITQSIIMKGQSLKALLIVFVISFCLGCLFKVQHWPFATMLMLTGVCGVGFIYTPIHYFTEKKGNHDPDEHLLSHFLMFFTCTMIFLLFDLSAL